MPTLRVLFLCTGNACRSQMAEGWARARTGAVIDAHSAGTHPQALDPLAVQVMAEAGVDLATQPAKPLDAGQDRPFDDVVTICREAHETCPVFPGRARIVHRGFDDPPRLAATARRWADALRHDARVRDEINALIEPRPDALLTETGDTHDEPDTPLGRDARGGVGRVSLGRPHARECRLPAVAPVSLPVRHEVERG
jgi:arsenate reductase